MISNLRQYGKWLTYAEVGVDAGVPRCAGQVLVLSAHTLWVTSFLVDFFQLLLRIFGKAKSSVYKAFFYFTNIYLQCAINYFNNRVVHFFYNLSYYSVHYFLYHMFIVQCTPYSDHLLLFALSARRIALYQSHTSSHNTYTLFFSSKIN